MELSGGLEGMEPFPSLSLTYFFALVGGDSGLRGLWAFSWRGVGFPWAFGWRGFRCLAGVRGLASLGKRAENFFEEKACTLRNVRPY